MTRSMRVLTASVACCFLLAACGGSGSGKTSTTKTIGNSVPLTDPPVKPAAPIAPAACSLVSTAKVAALLGAAAKQIETDPQPTYKTCEWDTTPATAGDHPNTLYLGLIRVGSGQAGFGTTLVGFTAQVLAGVGDSATYFTRTSSTGLEERFLVAKKGSVSMSISALYAGASVPPASIQDQLSELAKAIFKQLHA